jgi:hypothetical protein
MVRWLPGTRLVGDDIDGSAGRWYRRPSYAPIWARSTLSCEFYTLLPLFLLCCPPL